MPQDEIDNAVPLEQFYGLSTPSTTQLLMRVVLDRESNNTTANGYDTTSASTAQDNRGKFTVPKVKIGEGWYGLSATGLEKESNVTHNNNASSKMGTTAKCPEVDDYIPSIVKRRRRLRALEASFEMKKMEARRRQLLGSSGNSPRSPASGSMSTSDDDGGVHKDAINDLVDVSPHTGRFVNNMSYKAPRAPFTTTTTTSERNHQYRHNTAKGGGGLISTHESEIDRTVIVEQHRPVDAMHRTSASAMLYRKSATNNATAAGSSEITSGGQRGGDNAEFYRLVHDVSQRKEVLGLAERKDVDLTLADEEEEDNIGVGDLGRSTIGGSSVCSVGGGAQSSIKRQQEIAEQFPPAQVCRSWRSGPVALKLSAWAAKNIDVDGGPIDRTSNSTTSSQPHISTSGAKAPSSLEALFIDRESEASLVAEAGSSWCDSAPYDAQNDNKNISSPRGRRRGAGIGGARALHHHNTSVLSIESKPSASIGVDLSGFRCDDDDELITIRELSARLEAKERLEERGSVAFKHRSGFSVLHSSSASKTGDATSANANAFTLFPAEYTHQLGAAVGEKRGETPAPPPSPRGSLLRSLLLFDWKQAVEVSRHVEEEVSYTKHQTSIDTVSKRYFALKTPFWMYSNFARYIACLHRKDEQERKHSKTATLQGVDNMTPPFPSETPQRRPSILLAGSQRGSRRSSMIMSDGGKRVGENGILLKPIITTTLTNHLRMTGLERYDPGMPTPSEDGANEITTPNLANPYSLSPSSVITSPTTTSSKSVSYVSGSIVHRTSYELADAPDDFRRSTALPLPINCEALASYIKGRRMLVSELQRLTIRDPKVLLKDGYAVPVTPDDRRAKCVLREAVFTKLQHIVKTSGISGLQALKPIGKLSGSNQPHYLRPITTRSNRSTNSTNNKRPHSATHHNTNTSTSAFNVSSASTGATPGMMTSSGQPQSISTGSAGNNSNGPTLITADVDSGLSALMVSMGNTFITSECIQIKGRQLDVLADSSTRHKAPLISFEGGRIDTTPSSLLEASANIMNKTIMGQFGTQVSPTAATVSAEKKGNDEMLKLYPDVDLEVLSRVAKMDCFAPLVQSVLEGISEKFDVICEFDRQTLAAVVPRASAEAIVENADNLDFEYTQSANTRRSSSGYGKSPSTLSHQSGAAKYRRPPSAGRERLRVSLVRANSIRAASGMFGDASTPDFQQRFLKPPIIAPTPLNDVTVTSSSTDDDDATSPAMLSPTNTAEMIIPIIVSPTGGGILEIGGKGTQSQRSGGHSWIGFNSPFDASASSRRRSATPESTATFIDVPTYAIFSDVIAENSAENSRTKRMDCIVGADFIHRALDESESDSDDDDNITSTRSESQNDLKELSVDGDAENVPTTTECRPQLIFGKGQTSGDLLSVIRHHNAQSQALGFSAARSRLTMDVQKHSYIIGKDIERKRMQAIVSERREKEGKATFRERDEDGDEVIRGNSQEDSNVSRIVSGNSILLSKPKHNQSDTTTATPQQRTHNTLAQRELESLVHDFVLTEINGEVWGYISEKRSAVAAAKVQSRLRIAKELEEVIAVEQHSHNHLPHATSYNSKHSSEVRSGNRSPSPDAKINSTKSGRPYDADFITSIHGKYSELVQNRQDASISHHLSKIKPSLQDAYKLHEESKARFNGGGGGEDHEQGGGEDLHGSLSSVVASSRPAKVSNHRKVVGMSHAPISTIGALGNHTYHPFGTTPLTLQQEADQRDLMQKSEAYRTLMRCVPDVNRNLRAQQVTIATASRKKFTEEQIEKAILPRPSRRVNGPEMVPGVTTATIEGKVFTFDPLFKRTSYD